MQRLVLAVTALALAVAVTLWLAEPVAPPDEASVVQAPTERPAPAGSVDPMDAGEPLSSAEPLTTAPLATSAESTTAESATADPSAADPVAVTGEPLVVHVRFQDGSPAPLTMLTLWVADMRVDEGLSDEQGRWERAGRDGPVELLAHGQGPEPGFLALAHGRGEVELVLPTGAGLTGVLRIDGVPPGRRFPVGLRLVSRKLPRGSGRRPGARGMTPHGEIGSTVIGGQLAASDGSFRFDGWEPGDKVLLLSPEGYRLDEAASTPQPVTLPAHGVVLALHAPPMIHGRVVGPDGQGAGDARLDLKLSYHRRDGTGTSRRGIRDAVVRPDGHFQIPLFSPFRGEDAPAPQDVVLDLDLAAQGPDATSVQVQRQALPLDLDHDLGELVLAPVQQLVLWVRDANGQPLSDAVARPESTRYVEPLEADENGYVTVDVADANRGWVTVLAPGHESRRVPVEDATDIRPVRVTLPPTAGVTLRLLGPWDEPVHGPPEAWGFQVELSAIHGAFQDEQLPVVPPDEENDAGPDPLRHAIRGGDGSQSIDHHGDGTRVYSWWLDGTEFGLSGLHSRHPLRLGVRVKSAPESFGTPPEGLVWERRDVVLAPGETLTLDVPLQGLVPVR